MEGCGGHGAHHLSAKVTLAEGTSQIERGDVDGWEAAVVANVAEPFTPLRAQLGRDFPPGKRVADLRIICSSGFYYLAVAADVVKRKDAPRYISYDEARPKVVALVASGGASAQDRANGVRFVQCLDYIRSEDSGRVQIVCAREWTINKKPYRVTWSTGAFIQHLNEAYYSIEMGEDEY